MYSQEVYSPAEVSTILEIISENPKGFREKLVARFCKTITQEQIVKSMEAWDIDPNGRLERRPNGHSTDCICYQCRMGGSHIQTHVHNSSHRTSRSRKN